MKQDTHVRLHHVNGYVSAKNGYGNEMKCSDF